MVPVYGTTLVEHRVLVLRGDQKVFDDFATLEVSLDAISTTDLFDTFTKTLCVGYDNMTLTLHSMVGRLGRVVAPIINRLNRLKDNSPPATAHPPPEGNSSLNNLASNSNTTSNSVNSVNLVNQVSNQTISQVPSHNQTPAIAHLPPGEGSNPPLGAVQLPSEANSSPPQLPNQVNNQTISQGPPLYTGSCSPSSRGRKQPSPRSCTASLRS